MESVSASTSSCTPSSYSSSYTDNSLVVADRQRKVPSHSLSVSRCSTCGAPLSSCSLCNEDICSAADSSWTCTCSSCCIAREEEEEVMLKRRQQKKKAMKKKNGDASYCSSCSQCREEAEFELLRRVIQNTPGDEQERHAQRLKRDDGINDDGDVSYCTCTECDLERERIRKQRKHQQEAQQKPRQSKPVEVVGAPPLLVLPNAGIAYDEDVPPQLPPLWRMRKEAKEKKEKEISGEGEEEEEKDIGPITAPPPLLHSQHKEEKKDERGQKAKEKTNATEGSQTAADETATENVEPSPTRRALKRASAVAAITARGVGSSKPISIVQSAQCQTERNEVETGSTQTETEISTAQEKEVECNIIGNELLFKMEEDLHFFQNDASFLRSEFSKLRYEHQGALEEIGRAHFQIAQMMIQSVEIGERLMRQGAEAAEEEWKEGFRHAASYSHENALLKAQMSLMKAEHQNEILQQRISIQSLEVAESNAELLRALASEENRMRRDIAGERDEELIAVAMHMMQSHSTAIASEAAREKLEVNARMERLARENEVLREQVVSAAAKQSETHAKLIKALTLKAEDAENQKAKPSAPPGCELLNVDLAEPVHLRFFRAQRTAEEITVGGHR